MPTVSGLGLRRVSLANFRQSLRSADYHDGEHLHGLASIIAFGLVYNSARISLSERARELASLRVFGFTRGEVLWILLLELALLTIAAQPPGWVDGLWPGLDHAEQLAGELMRVRLVVENSTYILASAIVIVAAVFSALVVRERGNQLDLVAVLKTRD